MESSDEELKAAHEDNKENEEMKSPNSQTVLVDNDTEIPKRSITIDVDIDTVREAKDSKRTSISQLTPTPPQDALNISNEGTLKRPSFRDLPLTATRSQENFKRKQSMLSATTNVSVTEIPDIPERVGKAKVPTSAKVIALSSFVFGSLFLLLKSYVTWESCSVLAYSGLALFFATSVVIIWTWIKERLADRDWSEYYVKQHIEKMQSRKRVRRSRAESIVNVKKMPI